MIFLDSSDIKEIKRFNELGIISGVTTNPSIMLRDGAKNLEDIKKRTIEIAEEMLDKPVSVEVLSNNPKDMIKQAKQFSDWARNINIKIPFHGPNGELHNIKIMKELAQYGIDINCTAMMTAQQCACATIAGARFVSLFGGRVNDIGYNCIEEIKKIRNFLRNFHYEGDTDLIIGSVREPLNIIEWLNAGADIVTTPPKILEKSLIHPRTKETVQQFLEDSAKLKGLLWTK